MHGLLVTFRSTVPVEHLAQPFGAYADGLMDVPGLVSKAWLNDGATIGGFYLFSDRSSLDAYLSSPMVAELRGNPAFDDFEVRTFDILDDLSGRTGIRAEVLSA